ncbi:pyridoxamine 5'-phosphate oxidase family protein [Paenibacillus lemnae]|uniref:Pyridoxamine 5'-phosphate oxidase family protein n=1 Tax=Paenibacillus lemnae TaxID=1330551 RepID=A0A848MA83_PAELE|nr:pyridoxamine 5'-phosphate oxidase family protein [Paenibacillus lemnae]NMO96384.1 pyridoxamine 5'-phosphate oxidase family protein [Paenibacillus lemnae]
MQNIKMPAELYQFLNGKNLPEKQKDAILLLSVGEDGWPHSAMISAGEAVAVDEGTLRLALWPGTTTTGNLIRTGKATLICIQNTSVYIVKLSLRVLEQLENARHPRERFEGIIESVREDAAKYAQITSGVTFQLHEPDGVLARWEETLSELRE